MTTLSGTANFNVDRNTVIADAYRCMQVIGELETPSAEQITVGARWLNMMVKAWSTLGLQLWTTKQLIIPLIINKTSYTIGPAPADVIALRPLRVSDAFVRFVASNNDVPVEVKSRRHYFNLGQKTSTGVTNTLFYDQQLDRGVLFIYPVALSTGTHELHLTVQNPLQDINLATENADVPQEWLLALAWNLANELATINGLPEFMIKHIGQQATLYREGLSDFDSAEEDVSVYFHPERGRR